MAILVKSNKPFIVDKDTKVLVSIDGGKRTHQRSRLLDA